MTAGEVRSTLGTTADVLREAARLMRERAQACIDTTPDVDDGQWWTAADMRQALIERGGYADEADAEHIASWRPAVALAVADWLEVTARDPGASDAATEAALAVATAYLGESA